MLRFTNTRAFAVVRSNLLRFNTTASVPLEPPCDSKSPIILSSPPATEPEPDKLSEEKGPEHTSKIFFGLPTKPPSPFE